MPAPSAVTFDFWNTLVVEPPGLLSELRRAAVQAVLEARGVVLGADELERRLATAGRMHDRAWSAGAAFTPSIAADALAGAIAALDAAGREELATAYLEACASAELRLAPGAAELLRTLHGAGVPLGIVCDVGLTGSPFLRAFLRRCDLLRCFDGWAFSDEVGCFKPAPAIFRHALARVGVRDGRGAVHVGDLRRTDVAGARGVGMLAVRYRGVVDDAGEGPEGDRVIDDLGELMELLD